MLWQFFLAVAEFALLLSGRFGPICDQCFWTVDAEFLGIRQMPLEQRLRFLQTAAGGVYRPPEEKKSNCIGRKSILVKFGLFRP